MSKGLIGTPVRRLEDAALLTGEARFVDDIELPGMLECAFVRSPHPHAVIRSINSDAAINLPGVHAVFSYSDLAPLLTKNFIPPDNPALEFAETTKAIVLAEDEVCYVGEIVAIVLANSRYTAEDALALVDVDYEILPAISDCREAIAIDAPRAHRYASNNIVAEFRTEYGDCHTAFANAAHVLTLSLKQHRGSGHPIEGRGIVIEFDASNDGLTAWSSTQGAHRVRNSLVDIFGLDESRVRAATPDVGGGFGSKHIVYPEEVIAAGAALLQKCSVKWVEDRREHFLAAIQERDQYWEVEVATDQDGHLLGVRGSMIHDQGAYTLLGFNVPHNASLAVPGPYVLPNYQLDVTIATTNRVGTIPVRGAGYPEGTFTMERLLDRVADDLGMGRDEVRRRNLISADMIPYELPMRARDGSTTQYESGDYPACLQKALDSSDFKNFPDRQARAKSEGRYIGIGLANCTKITGRGPFETGIVRIGPSGQIIVHTGAMAMGQGIKTAYAQICADQFGVDPKNVKVIAGDTRTVPMGIGGFGSRQTVTAGSSIHLASIEVRGKALKTAAHMLEVSEQDLELRDGEISIKGVPELFVTLSDVAKALSGAVGYPRPKDMPPGLEATVNFLPTGLTYGNGVHVVEVEVDIGTGGIEITRYVVVNDSGRLINPLIVEGQIIGGVAHGIGNSLFEWMGYDKTGQPITTTFAEYLLPTAPVVPNIEIIHHQTPSTVNPLGVKGVGEAGVIPAAPAIMSAIEDALKPFGVRISEAPISPPRIIELIEEAISKP
jgi:carbon-monoxide dehydrogenase large subunit